MEIPSARPNGFVDCSMMYPAALLLLSCLMIPAILASIWGNITHFVMSLTTLPWSCTEIIKVWLRGPPDKSPTKKRIIARRRLCVLRDLLMLSAALPQIVTSSAVKFGGYCGVTDTSQLSEPHLQYLRQAVTLIPSGLLSHDHSFAAVVDTGCTSPITGFEEDFVAGTLKTLQDPVRIRGIAGAVPIRKRGLMRWQVVTDSGSVKTFEHEGYFLPGLGTRLLSPQVAMSDPEGPLDEFACTRKQQAKFRWVDGEQLTISIDPQTRLYTLTCFHDALYTAEVMALHGFVDGEKNQNLTASQKLVLKFHHILGHQCFRWIIHAAREGWLGGGVRTVRINENLALETIKCASCLFGKGRRRWKGHSHSHTEKDGALKKDTLVPGQVTAVDQYEVRVRGRLLASKGKTPSRDMLCGGTIFVDIASGRVKTFHQVSLAALDTIRSKIIYERDALHNGVMIRTYHTDNGVFTAKTFVQELDNKAQDMKICGVGAHHQNGVAEAAVRTTTLMARTMMLHLALRWPDAVDQSLWPFALSYACDLYNAMPRETTGWKSPDSIFSGSLDNYQLLRDAHCWGCPAYVLDPKLQGLVKIPRWEPRTRRGIFLGFSDLHSSRVGLILNPRTGHVSPQFHVVYDDHFETVANDGDYVPPSWPELVLSNSHTVALDEDANVELDEEWMNEEEIAARRARERDRRDPTGEQREPEVPDGPDPPPDPQLAKLPTTETPVETRVPDITSPEPVQRQPTRSHVMDLEEALEPPRRTRPIVSATEGVPRTPAASPRPATPRQARPKRRKTRVDATDSIASRVGRRRAGLFGMAQNRKSWAAGLLATTVLSCLNPTMSEMAYLSTLMTDPMTGLVDNVHPLYGFKAKKGHDPDTPLYHQAMMRPDADEFRAAQLTEIAALDKKRTWELMLRQDLPPEANLLPSTWAFKVKRYPDNRIRKYKARFCARGDKQIDGVDVFDTYAPVVSWASVRMMMVLSTCLGWDSVQVDFDAAFVHADLPPEECVHLELPRDFEPPLSLPEGDYVMKLKKNLYGLKQAPLHWFEKLREALLDPKRGFTQSKIDPCMFYKKDMVVLCYVDDCLFFCPDKARIATMVDGLKADKFDISVEADVSAFLGIEVLVEDNQVTLKQPGLTQRVLEAAGMLDCNVKHTPASPTPLGTNADGEPFHEEWEYASVVGMLMYLCSNTRPDIQYAVHQCARFNHCARATHADAIRQICRYLKGTADKGIIFEPESTLKLDCYVDADFAGLWRHEDEQDPVCVRSRTGYVITLGNCPLLWASKLQKEVALSTAEAEYIALSQSMRDLLPMRRQFKELVSTLELGTAHKSTFKSTVFEDNNACISMASTPKMSPRTKHIGIKYHFFKSHIDYKDITVEKIDTKEQKADIFTKGVPAEQFRILRKLLMGW